MFGAPAGALTGCGKSLFESFARRLIVPLNGCGGTGNTVPFCAGVGSALSALPGCAKLSDSRSLAVSQPRITPAASIPTDYLCKGSYFTLSGRAPFSRLIYPVPQHAGLGVHLTLDMGGQAKFGPDDARTAEVRTQLARATSVKP